jgi:hypothetical protein
MSQDGRLSWPGQLARVVLGTVVLGFASAAGTVLPAGADAKDHPIAAYAAIDTPGPKLSVPESELRHSLRCSGELAHASREPVLLVPGTTVTPEEHYGFNYMPALDALSWPWCAVTTPDHAMSDMQISAEYVVYAIRTMYERTGRRIALLGGSQGGSLPRWALRFWPDTRAMVADHIGLGATNRGGQGIFYYCLPASASSAARTGCAPALWQQLYNSDLARAMNSGQETFEGISYTEVSSRQDNITTPSDVSLHSGDGRIANVAVQDVCPGYVADHIRLVSYDPVGYALALDALTHDGPADPARIDRSVCTQQFPPGIEPATFITGLARAYATISYQMATGGRVPEEPPLRCYVTASCG